MLKQKFLMCLTTFILSACSDAKFALVNLPQVTYKGEIIKDVAYGDYNRQFLDIYIPSGYTESLPVIVFFHGGRWTFGSKDQYKFVGMALSKMGYIVVLPNTRLYPDVKFPTFVEDGAKALSWVHNNISEYGGNDTLFLSGHSSGAHIAALLTANETYLQPYDLNPNTIIDAFAGLSGPYDFVPEDEDLKDMFGPPANYPNMQVTNFIDGNEPPMLLIYGQKDDLVWPRNHELLAKKIRVEGGDVKVALYPNANHVDTVSALSWVSGLTVADDIDTFFKQ